jgi:hypothetical protein
VRTAVACDVAETAVGESDIVPVPSAAATAMLGLDASATVGVDVLDDSVAAHDAAPTVVVAVAPFPATQLPPLTAP